VSETTVETVSLDDFEDARRRAIAALRDGGLVVVPTDTVYGVVADAFQPQATQRLFAAKGQSRDVPLPVVIRTPRQVNGLVEDVPEAAERLMAAYWPGPLTLVFRTSTGLTWDLGEDHGTVALRLPSDDLLLAVVADVGPLACTGANRRGEPAPSSVSEAAAQLGAAVALYVDGGPRAGQGSTIVDVTHDAAHVLRSGTIPDDHIRQVATGEVGWGQRPDEDPPPATPAAEDPPPGIPAAEGPPPGTPAAEDPPPGTPVAEGPPPATPAAEDPPPGKPAADGAPPSDPPAGATALEPPAPDQDPET
jgi:tRNA threonylcarbamoyl adenosine modification protein (Sua5/YciO/YrdC/YwlC family)